MSRKRIRHLETRYCWCHYESVLSCRASRCPSPALKVKHQKEFCSPVRDLCFPFSSQMKNLPARRPSPQASPRAPLTCFQPERQSNPNLFHLLLPAHLLPQQWDLSAPAESQGCAPSLSVFRIKKLNKSPQGQSLTLRKEVVNVESRTGCDSWLISPGNVGYLRTFTRLKL
uniref:Uncharacterized protein n=1 Tax=Corvus moneduloides TaxID=1196302 RepID=A0A8C3E143_CORMO